MKLIEIIRDIDNLAENIPDDVDYNAMPPQDAFCKFWPIVRATLTLIKLITGKKGDSGIDKAIVWGDLICMGSQFKKLK